MTEAPVTPDPSPLRPLPVTLRSPLLRQLWAVVHDRLSSGRPVSRIRVGPLSAEEQAAVADLLGARKLPGPTPMIALERLDTALLEATGRNTASVIADLVSPIGNRRRDSLSRNDSRSKLWAWLDSHEVIAAQPVLREWAQACRRAGLVAGPGSPAGLGSAAASGYGWGSGVRSVVDSHSPSGSGVDSHSASRSSSGSGSVDSTRRLLQDALAVLDALPGDGIPLPVFAVRVLGDTHALDPNRRLSALVLKALACMYGVDVPMGAQARRALWEQAGIADDALSVTVLAAGFRPRTAGLVPDILGTCADAGQAASLTLAQLRNCAELVLPGTDVWIVENPSIVSHVLRRLGIECPPLVCLSGWPNSAGMALLSRLGAAGQRLHYHGDFDGEGIRIGAHVMAKSGALPWRFGAADYLSAVQRNSADLAVQAGSVGVGSDPVGLDAMGPVPLGPVPQGLGRLPVGRLSPAPWDNALTEVMAQVDVLVAEEEVLDELLQDLTAEAF